MRTPDLAVVSLYVMTDGDEAHGEQREEITVQDLVGREPAWRSCSQDIADALARTFDQTADTARSSSPTPAKEVSVWKTTRFWQHIRRRSATRWTCKRIVTPSTSSGTSATILGPFRDLPMCLFYESTR